MNALVKKGVTMWWHLPLSDFRLKSSFMEKNRQSGLPEGVSTFWGVVRKELFGERKIMHPIDPDKKGGQRFALPKSG